MSKTNYRRCVNLGVTGQHTATCFPASIDKLLPHRRVIPEYYEYYDESMDYYPTLTSRHKNPFLKKLYNELQAEIDAEPFVFLRVRSRLEFINTVRTALRNDQVVTADLSYPDDKDVAHTLLV